MKRIILLFFIILSGLQSFSQDLEFKETNKYLTGKKIIKIHKDRHDPYLWALGDANDVYRINTDNGEFDDLSANFKNPGNYKLIDIAAVDKDNVFIATSSNVVIAYINGTIKMVGSTGYGIQGIVNSIGMFGTNQVMFGSDKELYSYDINLDLLQTIDEGPKTFLYESVYRKRMYTVRSESRPGYTNLPAVTNWRGGYNIPNIFSGDKFGDPINSATFTTNAISEESAPSIDIFWGSSSGLFQMKNADDKMVPLNTSRYYNIPGINKVTDIIGLAAFELPVSKANLLLGSDKGLFWSKSYLSSGSSTELTSIAFSTSQSTGAIVPNNGLITDAVYDIEINSDITINPFVSCEDMIWVASSTGVYQLKPDWGIPPPASSGIHFKGMLASVGSKFICSDPLILVAEPSPTAALQIRWYKDGVLIPGADKREISVTAPGKYSSQWYAVCENVSVITNELTVFDPKNPIYTFNYPAVINACEGTEVKLEASGLLTYEYRWYRNGLLVPDSISKTFTARTSGKYRVEVGACDTWQSNPEVEVKIESVPEAIIEPSRPAYCAGDEATLTLNLPVSASYSINWYRDGILLDQTTNLTVFKTKISGNYTVIVKLLSGQTMCSRTSKAVNIDFQPFPAGTIEQIVKTTLCEGQTITLRSSYTNGAILWSTGETGSEIIVTKSGTYTAKLTSTSGCISEITTNVALKPVPVFAVADVKICKEDNQPVTITAPRGFLKYTWNGVSSTKNEFSVTDTGVVTLIVEDQNGCTAIREIKVISECVNLKPFSVFTPNGDGINDLWKIAGIENYPDCHIQVFNRNGMKVFDSKGNYISWNGTIKGQRLPAGVYYYTISAKNSTRTFKGSVSIFY